MQISVQLTFHIMGIDDVNHIVKDSSGRYICAGRFNIVNGQSFTIICRLTSSGLLDTSLGYGTLSKK